MVGEPNATMEPTLQDDQLMSKHRVLGFKPQLRLEGRGQDGQNEPEQPDHSANLGDSIPASTRMRFSVHTPVRQRTDLWSLRIVVDKSAKSAIGPFSSISGAAINSSLSRQSRLIAVLYCTHCQISHFS